MECSKGEPLNTSQTSEKLIGFQPISSARNVEEESNPENQRKKDPQNSENSAPPKQRVPLGDAFRMSGLDEHRIAKEMAGLVDDLKTRDEPKLLLDALKESSRHLEGVKNAPMTVSLIHRVPRPVRRPKDAEDTPAEKTAEPEPQPATTP